MDDKNLYFQNKSDLIPNFSFVLENVVKNCGLRTYAPLHVSYLPISQIILKSKVLRHQFYLHKVIIQIQTGLEN